MLSNNLYKVNRIVPKNSFKLIKAVNFLKKFTFKKYNHY